MKYDQISHNLKKYIISLSRYKFEWKPSYLDITSPTQTRNAAEKFFNDAGWANLVSIRSTIRQWNNINVGSLNPHEKTERQQSKAVIFLRGFSFKFHDIFNSFLFAQTPHTFV